MKRLLLPISGILVFASCDCVQDAKGVILDSITKSPIARVEVRSHDRKPKYSDDGGLFEYNDISGGPGGCPGLVLYFSKRGYKTKKMTFAANTVNDTVYLERDHLQ